MSDLDHGLRLRLATYNVHKCLGCDNRTTPERIIEVLREIKADIICLQEVVNAPEGLAHWNHAEQIAEAFPHKTWTFGASHPLYGAACGNMTLTRFPIEPPRHEMVTHPNGEHPCVLETEVALPGERRVRIFNVHQGTGPRERRHQPHLPLNEAIAEPCESSPRIVIGGFNEWTRTLATPLLPDSFDRVKPRRVLGHRRIFPSLLPVLTLDHCYYEPPLVLEHTELWRSRSALVASDHLPLITTFRVP